MRPVVGAVFVNPRGRKYTVVGHMLDGKQVVVQDASGLMDLAVWALMTEENGWCVVPADKGAGRWCGKQWGGGETIHVCDLEKHEGPCHWPGK